VIGLYGVKSYVMSRRTREFGVRMAIGATPAEIIRMAMREATRTTVIGVSTGLVLGAAAGFGLSRMTSLFSPFDAPSVLAATATLTAAALLATFVPARRASKISPMTALRDS
jgi:ABC-type antimicrobial peptide transport system permease subunit